MILGFKPQFEEPILREQKIHTIREDVHNRWVPGRKITFATGVRTKHYRSFMEGMCVSVQKIEIKWFQKVADRPRLFDIRIEGRSLSPDEILNLGFNDGFDHPDDLLQWFNKDFTGKIIHWTDFKY